jgi:type II secretory pathway pseudopilin PulG
MQRQVREPGQDRVNKPPAKSEIGNTMSRNARSVIRGSRGFTYLALLVAIIIIGISMTSAARYWQYISLREKEEELLFRGLQYRSAIERYYCAIPGRAQYPQSIEDLLKDNRTVNGRRHLRQQYKDPITGEDFVPIQDPATKRIAGVRSSSEKKPLKQADFPEECKDFEEKEHYSDWQFQVGVVSTITRTIRGL